MNLLSAATSTEGWIINHNTAIAAWITAIILFMGFSFDNWYRRRKIAFTGFELRELNSDTTPISLLNVFITGNSEREVKLSHVEAITKNGLKSNHCNSVPNDLPDGISGRAICTFIGRVREQDIYKIVLTDSTKRGKYKGYIYKGKFRNRFVVWFLLCLERIAL